MSKYIEHDGTIVAQISPHKYRVKIVQQSACSTCKAASLCTVAESKEKIVEAIAIDNTHTVGDVVVIYGKLSMGYKALFMAMIIPLLLALATLIIVSQLTPNEIISGVASLAILVPYYTILWLMRGKIKQIFNFYIRHKI